MVIICQDMDVVFCRHATVYTVDALVSNGQSEKIDMGTSYCNFPLSQNYVSNRVKLRNLRIYQIVRGIL